MNPLNKLNKTNNLLSIIFSILFLFGIYKIVNDFSLIAENISKISASILIMSTLVYFSSVFLRYMRWKIIYSHQFNSQKFNMLNETIIGYMANNLLPFRLGEIYRVNRIVKSEQNSFIRVLSTIFTERFFDVIVLLIILILAFPFIDKFDLKVFQVQNTFLLFLLIVFLLFFSIFLLKKISIFENIIIKFLNLFRDLLSFFLECKSYKKYFYIISISLLIWIVESIVYFIVADFFITDISNAYLFSIILIVCSITNLSGVIPSLPGNIGNFEFFGTLAFIAMNINSSTGATIIIIVHLVLFVPISILGFIILSLEKIPFKK